MNDKIPENDEDEGIVVVAAVFLAAAIVCSVLFILATINWKYLMNLFGINL